MSLLHSRYTKKVGKIAEEDKTLVVVSRCIWAVVAPALLYHPLSSTWLQRGVARRCTRRRQTKRSIVRRTNCGICIYNPLLIDVSVSGGVGSRVAHGGCYNRTRQRAVGVEAVRGVVMCRVSAQLHGADGGHRACCCLHGRGSRPRDVEPPVPRLPACLHRDLQHRTALLQPCGGPGLVLVHTALKPFGNLALNSWMLRLLLLLLPRLAAPHGKPVEHSSNVLLEVVKGTACFYGWRQRRLWRCAQVQRHVPPRCVERVKSMLKRARPRIPGCQGWHAPHPRQQLPGGCYDGRQVVRRIVRRPLRRRWRRDDGAFCQPRADQQGWDSYLRMQ